MNDHVTTILKGITKTQRVANGYIFVGADPELKVATALNFAKTLNCTSEERPCGACLSCRKIDGSVHPDVMLLEKDEKSFKIEQVQKLKELTHYGPAEGAYKVIIINDADTLTLQAANSFLKTLEEPPENVTFILICNREEGLLPTIASRCQKIIFRETAIKEPPEEIKKMFEALKDKPSDYIGNTDAALKFEHNAENLLGGLFTLFALERMPGEALRVMDALRNIKKSGNKKLVLDWMCLKIWKKN
jgi:DNA polymerase III subunit delta'